MSKKIVSKLYMWLIYLFLYAPIIVLIIFSFNDSKSRSVWSGFTLKWYKLLLNDKEILMALRNTLVIAFISAIIATIIGTMAAITVSNSKKWLSNILSNISNLPMMNPEIVTGVSLMLLFAFLSSTFGILSPGFGTLILSHITFCAPYVMLSVTPKLGQMDKNILEAAQDLGCTRFQAFFKVVIPQISSGIVTGAIMAFTLSIDDFVISYFTSGTVQTLPIAVYSMTRKVVSPEINALSTLLFVTVFVLLIIVNFRQKNDSARKDKANR